MKRFWKSLPGPKITAVTIAVSLLLGVIVTGGLGPKALIGLVFGFLFLSLVTIRNLDPNGFEAWNDPKAYTYRMQRDELYKSLKAFAEAVESEDSSLVVERVAEAHAVLDKIAGKRKAIQ